jgi:hypothetical protein
LPAESSQEERQQSFDSKINPKMLLWDVALSIESYPFQCLDTSIGTI